MNPSSMRRLAADHAALHKTELPPYYLRPAATGAHADDLTQLHLLLTGPAGTPYQDGVWRLQLRMPADYPQHPPKAFFRTKIWHPNVDESTGSVCLDTLKRDWTPTLTLRDILVTISCLLINPNPDSALNAEAGKLLQENWDEYARRAKLMSAIHAKIPAGQREAALEARNRGEVTGAADETSPPAQPESEDEEENSKENDVFFALPVRASRPVARSTGRSTVLGKRPLADLPVPLEPPSDDEAEATSSARNIAANTPNLSNHLANVSFDSAMPVWASALSKANKATLPSKLIERTSNGNTRPGPSSPTGPPSKHAGPPAKRQCPGISDGKENVQENGIGDPFDAATAIGLGIKMQPPLGAVGRKPAAAAGHLAKLKPKPRLGMQRL